VGCAKRHHQAPIVPVADALLGKTTSPRLWSQALAALLGIGLTHLLLVWNGDILTEYAIAGFLALTLLWSERAVLPSALLLFAVRLAPLPFPERFTSSEAMRAHIVLANALYPHGSFGTVEAFRIRELPAILALPLGVLPRTLGLFALGIWAYRAGALVREGGRSRLVRTTAVVGLLAGGIGTLVTAGVLGDVSLGAWDSVATDFAAIALALGYGALLLVADELRPAQRVLDLFAPLAWLSPTTSFSRWSSVWSSTAMASDVSARCP
jgi:uncharacterized protein